MTRKKWAAWAPLFVVLLAALAFAGTAVQEQYKPVRKRSAAGANGVQAAHRTGLSGSDSHDRTATIDPQETGGDTSIVVAPRFSAGGATAQVEVDLLWLEAGSYTYTGISFVQTLTASTITRDAAGKYLVQNGAVMIVDTLGADAWDTRYVAVSSGTVDSYSHSTGATGVAAE